MATPIADDIAVEPPTGGSMMCHLREEDRIMDPFLVKYAVTTKPLPPPPIIHPFALSLAITALNCCYDERCNVTKRVKVSLETYYSKISHQLILDDCTKNGERLCNLLKDCDIAIENYAICLNAAIDWQLLNLAWYSSEHDPNYISTSAHPDFWKDYSLDVTELANKGNDLIIECGV
jgi:hypothetical protein